MRYRFGPFEIAADERVLRRGEDVVALPRAAVGLLLALLERPGRVVSKAELLRRVWPDVVVGENNLNQAVAALRRALGDATEEPRHVGTVARVGYRFLVPVVASSGEAAPSAPGTPAYALYLQGRHYANLLSPDGYAAARRCLERAIALDSGFALAHAGLAYLELQAAEIEAAAGDAMSRARREAEAALRVRPDLAEAHACLGTVRFMYDWDAPSAHAGFRAAAASPDWAPGARRLHGWFLTFLGRFDEAFACYAEAAEADPLSLERHLYETPSYWLARRHDEGLRAVDGMLRLFPELWLGHVLRGRMLEGLGEGARALEAFELAAQRPGSADEALGDLGRRRALQGDAAGARAALAELERRAEVRHVPAFHRAQVLLGLGDLDGFFAALQKARAERSWYLTWLLVCPQLDPARGDPRFRALVDDIGLWR